MSKIIVVYTNKKNGKLEFTKEELEALLDDAYSKGYVRGFSDTSFLEKCSAWRRKTITPSDGSCTGIATFDLKSNKYDVKY